MSDHPPGHSAEQPSSHPTDDPTDGPDPTRDVTDDADADADIDIDIDIDTAMPADLPAEVDSADGVPAYDTAFGSVTPPAHSWVPQRAADQPVHRPPAPPATPRPLRTLDLGALSGSPAVRALGGRLQAWHVVAIAAGLLVPAGIWVGADLADNLEPVARTTVNLPRPRLTVPRTVPLPQSTPTAVSPVPGAAPSLQVPRPTTARPTRSVMATPPPVVKVPAIPVTPVPTDARTIRFESYAAGGARIEVSLSDARHQRYDYPVRTSPLGFETSIDKKVSSSDYYSLRVRLYDPTGSGDRGAVVCRILVDGILVTSQQGRGYANCYISPYYDIQRR